MNYFCDLDDPPSAFKETMRRARTAHRCSECRSTIHPGETYEHVWGVWGGDVDTFKTCPTCLSLRNWVVAHIPCFCWNYKSMRADAHQAVADVLADEHVPGMFMEFGRLWVACKRRAAQEGKA